MERRKEGEIKMSKMTRDGWIRYMWDAGHRGKIDFFKQSSKVIPFSTSNIRQWMKGGTFGRNYDIMGFDQPRKDIEKLKIRGRTICIGGKHRKKIESNVRKVLTSNFTGQELKEINNLYIETSAPVAKAWWAGQHQGFCSLNGIKGSIVTIRKDWINNEHVLTHELVHAHRFATGRKYPYDTNKDEKETELETVARLSPQAIRSGICGYYTFLPKNSWLSAQLKDRKCLTGSEKKKLKGKREIKNVKDCYPKSEIRKVHFSPAEQIDRYFLVKLPNGTTIQVHQWYPKGRKGKLTEIKKAFKKKYGTGIKAWEYRNGKKVRII